MSFIIGSKVSLFNFSIFEIFFENSAMIFLALSSITIVQRIDTNLKESELI